MKNKISILLLASIIFNSCKSDENNLLSIGLSPTYSIDTIKNKVNIYVGPGFDIEKLDYQVTLSPKAKISTKPTNLAKPAFLEVTAENGEVKKYTVIATKVEGFISIFEKKEYIRNPPNPPVLPKEEVIKGLNRNFSCAHAKKGLFNDDLLIIGRHDKIGCYIDLAACEGNTTEDDFFIRLFFEGKDFNNLVGNYDIAGNTSVNAALSYIGPKNGEDPDFYSSSTLSYPESGKIEIVQFDAENNLISGKFTNIEFIITSPEAMETSNDISKIHYKLSGKFINVPIVP